MSDRFPCPATAADELAARISRLEISRRDPEAYHAEKSAIAADLRRLGRQLRGEVRRIPSTSWHAPIGATRSATEAHILAAKAFPGSAPKRRRAIPR